MTSGQTLTTSVRATTRPATGPLHRRPRQRDRYTVNSLGLPESVIEPSTVAQPGRDDRTWTASYDAAGLPVTLKAPGGVDRHADLRRGGPADHGDRSGAEVSTADGGLTYDVDGQVTKRRHAGRRRHLHLQRPGQIRSAAGPVRHGVLQLRRRRSADQAGRRCRHRRLHVRQGPAGHGDRPDHRPAAEAVVRRLRAISSLDYGGPGARLQLRRLRAAGATS